MEFDTSVKLALYDRIAASARMPDAAEVAQILGVEQSAVEETFLRLQQKRLLVLEPGTKDRIRMAPPFSGVPTQHVTHIDGKSYFANCAWDALGIAAALHKDADIDSECADCGEAMHFEVRGSAPVPRECAVHFAVPAAHWWDDIIHT